MSASIQFNYSIPFGTSLRVGYKVSASTNAYTYVTPYPDYTQSPYTLVVPGAGLYDLEFTTVCPSCSGGNFSTPQVITQVGAT